MADMLVTSAELAKLLRTTPEHAEQLLAHLLANGRALSPISDDGQVHYRSAKLPIRVASVPPAVLAAAKLTDAERDRLAEEELAEEEAAEAARREAGQTR